LLIMDKDLYYAKIIYCRAIDMPLARGDWFEWFVWFEV
jgi:hypothetical protein